MCAATWWPLVQDMMLMHRANLREATLGIIGDSDDSDNYDCARGASDTD